MELTKRVKGWEDRLATCNFYSPCIVCNMRTQTKIETINGGELHVCNVTCLHKAFETGELLEELLDER